MMLFKKLFLYSKHAMIWYFERISRKYEFFENDKIVFESMCTMWNKSNLDHVEF